MTDAELILWVGSLRYKPGWEFRYERVGPLGATVYVRARLEDAGGAHVKSEVLSQAVIPPQADLHVVMCLVHEAILKLEQHEIMEWFRSNGVPVFNPHPQGLGSFATRPQRPGEVLM